jgi:hypothetical protein
MDNEKELLLKLFQRGHINVPERNSLPFGKVRASIAHELILEKLKSFGWFPGDHQFKVGDSGGEYSQLELTAEGKAFLHLNQEYALLRFQHKVIPCKNIEDAIDQFLKYRSDRELDGLEILWDIKK